MDVAGHLAALWRVRWPALAVGIVVGLVVGVFVQMSAPAYHARVLLAVTVGSLTNGDTTSASALSAQRFATLAGTHSVQQAAAQAIGGGATADQVDKATTVTVDVTSSLVVVDAVGSASFASADANAVAAALVARVKTANTAQLQADIGPLLTQQQLLVTDLRGATGATAASLQAQYQTVGNAIVQRQSQTADSLSLLDGTANTVVARGATSAASEAVFAFLATAIVIGEALIWSRRARGLFTPGAAVGEIEALSGLPVLGSVGAGSADDRSSDPALVWSLLAADDPDRPRRVVLLGAGAETPALRFGRLLLTAAGGFGRPARLLSGGKIVATSDPDASETLAPREPDDIVVGPTADLLSASMPVLAQHKNVPVVLAVEPMTARRAVVRQAVRALGALGVVPRGVVLVPAPAAAHRRGVLPRRRSRADTPAPFVTTPPTSLPIEEPVAAPSAPEPQIAAAEPQVFTEATEPPPFAEIANVQPPAEVAEPSEPPPFAEALPSRQPVEPWDEEAAGAPDPYLLQALRMARETDEHAAAADLDRIRETRRREIRDALQRRRRDADALLAEVGQHWPAEEPEPAQDAPLDAPTEPEPPEPEPEPTEPEAAAPLATPEAEPTPVATSEVEPPAPPVASPSVNGVSAPAATGQRMIVVRPSQPAE